MTKLDRFIKISIYIDDFKLHDSHVNAPALPVCKCSANRFKLLSLITSHMRCAIFHYDCPKGSFCMQSRCDPPAARLRRATLLAAKGSAAYFRLRTTSMTVPFRLAYLLRLKLFKTCQRALNFPRLKVVSRLFCKTNSCCERTYTVCAQGCVSAIKKKTSDKICLGRHTMHYWSA